MEDMESSFGPDLGCVCVDHRCPRNSRFGGALHVIQSTCGARFLDNWGTMIDGGYLPFFLGSHLSVPGADSMHLQLRSILRQS
jgi:hypothetical protein